MLEIQLLGRPQIRRSGEPLQSPRGRKAWGLLAYLNLSEIREPSRAHLAELLFTDAVDPLRALRWNLSELRRILGPEVLKPGSVAIEMPRGGHLDTQVLTHGSPQEALSLPGLGRELLEGMSFPNSPAFESWLAHERRRLIGAAEAAIHEAALDLLAAGMAKKAIALARRLVASDPFDENFQELAIRAFAQAGDDAGAQAQLEECRRLFRAELGREPAESLARAAEEKGLEDESEFEPGTSPQRAAGALIEAGEAAVAAGAADVGLQSLRRALSQAEDTADQELEVRARLALGSALVHSVRGRDAEAAAVLGRAAMLAGELGLPELEAAAVRELSYTDALAGRYARCEARLRIAAAMATGARERAAIESVRALIASDRGAHATALEHLGAAMELGSSAGDLKRVAHANTFAGRSRLLSGDLQVARGHFEKAIAIVGETEWLSFAAWPQAWLAEAQLIEGDTKGARERMEYAFALACEFRDPCWEGLAGRGLGIIDEGEGKTGSALRRLEDARRRASRGTDRYVWVEAYALEAFAAAAVRAGWGRAPALVEDLLSLTSRTGMRELAVRGLVLRSQLGDRGAMDAARALAAELENPALVHDLSKEGAEADGSRT